MVAIVAALVFAAAFALAVGTMTFMFAAYRDKMIAALLYQPEPAPQPTYSVAILRTRRTVMDTQLAFAA
jgi:hypothetical protein